VIVSVSIELPGAIVAPVATVRVPVRPLPPIVAPEATVVALAMLPLTTSVPPLPLVAPV